MMYDKLVFLAIFCHYTQLCSKMNRKGQSPLGVIFIFPSFRDSGIIFKSSPRMRSLKMTKKSKRKALGQHFLHNRQLLRRIVNVIDPQPEEIILEIGAGKGALTFALAERKAKIIAVEKDVSLIPHLKKKDFSNLTIIDKDILRVHFRDLLPINEARKAKVVGNLPYSLSSPILFKVLAEKDVISCCVFLLQKEFAQRLCAQPGSKKYAPLSIIFQNFFTPRFHFSVSASFFSPPPKVESALMSLEKRSKPLFPIVEQELFLKFLKGAFQHRRKKLSNNLKRLHWPDSLIKRVLEICGIDGNLRPEQVSLPQFVRLFNCLQEKTSGDSLTRIIPESFGLNRSQKKPLSQGKK